MEGYKWFGIGKESYMREIMVILNVLLVFVFKIMIWFMVFVFGFLNLK